MANRVMQQKRTKMARMRRAWAKPYSMKGGGLAANPGFIDDGGKFTPISIRSRAKAGGISEDPWLSSIFKDNNPFKKTVDGSVVPNEDGIFARSAGPNANPRAVVLAKLIQSTRGAGSLQKEIQFVHQDLLNGRFVKLRIYVGGNEAFFVEQTVRPTKIIYRRSIVYQGREKALEKYGYGRIIWASHCVVPNPPSSDPPSD